MRVGFNARSCTNVKNRQDACSTKSEFLVEQASCLFIKGLLTLMQDLSFNRMQALRQGFKPLPGSGTSQKLDRAFIHNRAAPTHQAISQ
jgi:hypothetical protein